MEQCPGMERLLDKRTGSQVGRKIEPATSCHKYERDAAVPQCICHLVTELLDQPDVEDCRIDRSRFHDVHCPGNGACRSSGCKAAVLQQPHQRFGKQRLVLDNEDPGALPHCLSFQANEAAPHGQSRIPPHSHSLRSCIQIWLRPREPEMTADGAPAVVNAWHSRSAVRSGYA